MMNILPAVVVAIFGAKLDQVASQQWTECVKLTSCSCRSNKGVIDLSPLDTRDPHRPRFLDVHDQDSLSQYSFNPCTGFTEGRGLDCYSVAACVSNSDDEVNLSLGDQSSIDFVNDPQRGLELRTSVRRYGTTWSAHIQLVCDPYEQEPVLNVTGPDGNVPTYRMSLHSKYCCPRNPPLLAGMQTSFPNATTTTSSPTDGTTVSPADGTTVSPTDGTIVGMTTMSAPPSTSQRVSQLGHLAVSTTVMIVLIIACVVPVIISLACGIVKFRRQTGERAPLLSVNQESEQA